MKNKLFSILLSVAMLVGMTPVMSAFVMPEDVFAETLENANVSRALISAARGRMSKGLLSNGGRQGEGIATVGEAKVMALHVDFPDYSFEVDDTTEALAGIINTTPDYSSDRYPFEGLNAYYKRASYGRLDISGDAFHYTAEHNRDYYSNNLDGLFEEALTALDGSVNYDDYDKNEDGWIDAVYLHFAGPDTGWNTTWWSKVWSSNCDKQFDSVKMKKVSLLQYNSATEDAYHTIVHETGHVLGLPDLYNYDLPKSGHSGTLSWDIMENNTGDHNPLFKFLLGWIDYDQITRIYANETGITVKKGSEVIKTIEADADGESSVEEVIEALDWNEMSKCGGFVTVANIDKGLGLFDNYYLIEYVQPKGNQTINYAKSDYSKESIPEGFRIYRVQAEVNEDGLFKHTNTYGTIHNQLIEAIDMDENQAHREVALYTVPVGYDYTAYRCLPGAGDRIDCDTYPSTNFMEVKAVGFTGLSFDILKSDSGSGEIRIAYSPKGQPAFDKFTIKDATPYGAINDCKVKLNTSWKVLFADGTSNGTYEGFVWVNLDGVEWHLPATIKDTTISIDFSTALDKIRKDSDLSIMLPEGTLLIGNKNGEPILSKGMNIPIAIGPIMNISGKEPLDVLDGRFGIYTNALTIGKDIYQVNIGSEDAVLSKIPLSDIASGSCVTIKDCPLIYRDTADYGSPRLWPAGDGRLAITSTTVDGLMCCWINAETGEMLSKELLGWPCNGVAVTNDGTVFRYSSDGVARNMDYARLKDDNTVDKGSTFLGDYPLITAVSAYGEHDVAFACNTGFDTETKENKQRIIIIDPAKLCEAIDSENFDAFIEKNADKIIDTSTKDNKPYVYDVYKLSDNEYLKLESYLAGSIDKQNFDIKYRLCRCGTDGRLISSIILDEYSYIPGGAYQNIVEEKNGWVVVARSAERIMLQGMKSEDTSHEEVLLNISDMSNYEHSSQCGYHARVGCGANGFWKDDKTWAVLDFEAGGEKGVQMMAYFINCPAQTDPHNKTVINTGDNNYMIVFITLMLASVILGILYTGRLPRKQKH